MMKHEEYFCLYASCIPVRGYSRSLICDIQRNTFDFIPNSLYEIITKHRKQPISALISLLGDDNKNTIREYFNFLLDKEYIFICTREEQDRFPGISLSWEEPYAVTNAILDIDSESRHDLQNIISNLNILRVPHLQIRIFSYTPFDFLEKFSHMLLSTNIYTVEYILPNIQDLSTETIFNLCKNYLRISSIVFYGSPEYSEIDLGQTRVRYVQQGIADSTHCGIVDSSMFAVNRELFLESNSFNSCLHKKISIDKNGNIKNCSSMPESFGNIKDTTLAEALAKEGFKKYWGINKDKIAVCKDCEFRYICTDCRAYRENPDDIYSKPLKCGYDPYTNKWEEWSTNPIKQKAIEYYGLKNLDSATVHNPS